MAEYRVSVTEERLLSYKLPQGLQSRRALLAKGCSRCGSGLSIDRDNGLYCLNCGTITQYKEGFFYEIS